MNMKIGPSAPPGFGLPPPLDSRSRDTPRPDVGGPGHHKPVEPHPLSVLGRMPVVKHVIGPPLAAVGSLAHLAARFAKGVEAFCEHNRKAPKDLSAVISRGCEPDRKGQPSWCADAASRQSIETMATDSDQQQIMKSLWNAMNVQGHERRHGDPNMSLQAAVIKAHQLGKLPLERQPTWFRQIDQAINGPDAAQALARALPGLLQGCAGSLRGDVAQHMQPTLPLSSLQRTRQAL